MDLKTQVNLKKILKEINELADDVMSAPVEDQFDGAEISADNAILPQTPAPEMANAESSATEMLAAKTKISRAFDVLKDAYNDFQDAIVDSIELSGDNDIFQAINALSDSVTALQQAITPSEAQSLAPIDYQGFDTELPPETDEFDLSADIPEDDFDFESEDEESEDEDENGLGEDELEKDFDDEASLDIDDETDELDKEIEDEIK